LTPVRALALAFSALVCAVAGLTTVATLALVIARSLATFVAFAAFVLGGLDRAGLVILAGAFSTRVCAFATLVLGIAGGPCVLPALIGRVR
jgi:hypothetical protein